jgi:hypothetical protein
MVPGMPPAPTARQRTAATTELHGGRIHAHSDGRDGRVRGCPPRPSRTASEARRARSALTGYGRMRTSSKRWGRVRPSPRQAGRPRCTPRAVIVSGRSGVERRERRGSQGLAACVTGATARRPSAAGARMPRPMRMARWSDLLIAKRVFRRANGEEGKVEPMGVEPTTS